MKSFFLKVSLLAGLSLSGFCSVFAQSKVGGVLNTYLKVTSKADLIKDGVYIVASPIKDTTLIAVMAGPNKPDKSTYRYYIKLPSDSLRDEILYMNSTFISTTKENSKSLASEIYIYNNALPPLNPKLYFFDPIYGLSLKASNSDNTKGRDLTLYPFLDGHSYFDIQYEDNGQSYINFNKNNTLTNYSRLIFDDKFTCGRYWSDNNYAQLYRKVIPIKMTSAGYSTLCADYAFKMPEGLTGGIVKSDDGINLIIDYCYPTDSIVPAHTPIILKGAENTYNASVMSVEGNTYEGNYLYATVDAEGNTSVDGDNGTKYKYYKLAKYNNEVGFWWNAEGGMPFMNGQNKAYLALARNSSVAEVKGFTLEGLEQTGITNATTQENATSTAVYDLNGKLMPQTQTRSLPAGVYIINGKVTILKNNR